jgi:hypothetical protein
MLKLALDSVYSNLNVSNLDISSLLLKAPTYHTVVFSLKSVINFIGSFSPMSILTLFNVSLSLNKLTSANLSINTQMVSKSFNIEGVNSYEMVNNSVTYTSDNLTTNGLKESSNALFSETSNNVRFTRFNNPLISYDYKCGHYLGIWESLYPSLMTSYIEVARGIRKAPWFLSDQFTELLQNNHQNFMKKFTTQSNLKLADVDNWYSSHVAPIDNFFNMTYILKHKGCGGVLIFFLIELPLNSRISHRRPLA